MFRFFSMDVGTPDPATCEWLLSEEFPRRALRTEAPSSASERTALGDPPVPPTCPFCQQTMLSSAIPDASAQRPFLTKLRSDRSDSGQRGYTQGPGAVIMSFFHSFNGGRLFKFGAKVFEAQVPETQLKKI